MTEIICGEARLTMRELQPDSFDALITDPPYSSGGLFRGDRTADTRSKYSQPDYDGMSTLPNFSGDNRDGRSFSSWCADWLSLAWPLLKDGSPVCIFSDWRQLPSVTDAIQWAGYIWRGIVVWDKKNARPFKGRFRPRAEFVVWGSKGQMPVDRPVPALDGLYVGAPPTSATREHQTEKPVNVMRELVQIVVPGGRILDPFTGSGTTAVAAIMEGRECVGIEMDTHYAEVARRRISEAVIEK